MERAKVEEGAIGRMARRADMMRQRYNVAAHIGETAFQMGTEGWEEGRQRAVCLA